MNGPSRSAMIALRPLKDVSTFIFSLLRTVLVVVVALVTKLAPREYTTSQ